MPVAIGNYVALSAVMFFIGVAGVLLRRNPLVMLMSIELMFNAANLLFIAFARAWLANAGQVFAFLVITVAAAEAAIGLAIVVTTFRTEKNVDVDEIRLTARMSAACTTRWALTVRIRCSSRCGCCRSPARSRAGRSDRSCKTLCGWLASGARCRFVRADGACRGAPGRRASAARSARISALFSWIPGFDFGLLLDPLSLLWTFVITGVGFLIHFYSIGYMDGDRAYARFFAYMNFFVFAMLTLVLSDNFVGLLIGWGLVGLASYFLIGFWFERPTAVAAARKAFVINVVGDVAIMFAIFAIFGATSTRSRSATPSLPPDRSVLRCCFDDLRRALHRRGREVGADSAAHLAARRHGGSDAGLGAHPRRHHGDGRRLSHRALRAAVEREPDAQMLAGTIGALTAIVGAILGCVQWDIKRILAYSTMSQIGYMIMGVGVGAYEGGSRTSSRTRSSRRSSSRRPD